MDELINNIILKSISEEEYNKVKDIIQEEKKQNEEQNKPNYVGFQTSYEEDMQGIFIGNELVGLFKLGNFIDNKSIDIYILPKYRRHHIASIATSKIPEQYGENCSDKEYFQLNINPHNVASLGVARKLGWKPFSDYDEAMLEEGASFDQIFVKENPHYHPVHKK